MDPEVPSTAATVFADVSVEDVATGDPMKQIPALYRLLFDQCNGKECNHQIDLLVKVRLRHRDESQLLNIISDLFPILYCTDWCNLNDGLSLLSQCSAKRTFLSRITPVQPTNSETFDGFTFLLVSGLN